MKVFRAVVVSAEDVTPSLRRVVLGGPELADFESTGVGDEYLRVLLPETPDGEPETPIINDGVLDYDSIDLDRLRTYTVRAHDEERGEITIDFVVHEGGVAATWAKVARPGQVVRVNSPTGIYEPPEGLESQLLVADTAALPALARIVEQTPDGVRTRAVVEVAGPEHRLDLPGAEVTWVYGGNGHGPSRLEDAIRSLPLPGEGGYVWVAGETKALRGVRKYLRREVGLPATAYKAIGYWIADAEQWYERYEGLDDETRASLEALWDEDRPEDELEDEYDERLTALGL